MGCFLGKVGRSRNAMPRDPSEPSPSDPSDDSADSDDTGNHFKIFFRIPTNTKVGDNGKMYYC